MKRRTMMRVVMLLPVALFLLYACSKESNETPAVSLRAEEAVKWFSDTYYNVEKSPFSAAKVSIQADKAIVEGDVVKVPFKFISGPACMGKPAGYLTIKRSGDKLSAIADYSAAVANGAVLNTTLDLATFKSKSNINKFSVKDYLAQLGSSKTQRVSDETCWVIDNNVHLLFTYPIEWGEVYDFVVVACPSGTYFNPVAQYCDNYENIPCGTISTYLTHFSTANGDFYMSGIWVPV